MWGRGGTLEIWAVPDGQIVFPEALPETENDVFDQRQATLTLSAALNETVAAQLVFRSDQPAGVQNITVGELVGEDSTIPAGAVRLYRQHRTTVSEFPSWYLRLTPFLGETRAFPDVLVPLDAPRGGLPLAVDPGCAEAVWLELHVPPTLAGGRYRGEVRIISSGGATHRYRLELEVYPFALPATHHLTILCGLDVPALLGSGPGETDRALSLGRLAPGHPEHGNAVATLDAVVRLLHEHRCTPWLEDLAPPRSWEADGRPRIDWTAYDRWVGSMIDGTMFEDRVPAPAWPIPLTARDRRLAPAAGPDGDFPRESQRLIAYLAECAAHFAERGWLERSFVSPVRPGETAEPSAIEGWGRLVLQADRGLRLLGPLAPQPLGPFGDRFERYRDVRPWVGIWAPRADVADREALLQQRAEGKICWLRPCHPPYSGSLAVYASPVDAICLGWQAYRFGCEGLLLPRVNGDERSGAGEAPAADDGSGLLRPGTPYGLEVPVPTIRLKRLARAAQDHAYLRLLEQHQRRGVAEALAEDLLPYAGTDCYAEHLLDGRAHGWVTDPRVWSLARRLMAAELMLVFREMEAGTSPTLTDPVARLRQQVEWARLTRATRTVRVEVEGLRLPPRAPPVEAPLNARVQTVLFNLSSRDLSGRILLHEAPPGWTLAPESSRVLRIPPMKGMNHRADLIIRNWLPNAWGITPLSFGLEGPETPVESAPARFCLLRAPHLNRPVNVDGRLDEWPLGAGNTAGDFLLVGAVDVPKQNRPRPDRPSLGTTVFAAHDGKNLYLGFVCTDGELSRRSLGRGNTVRYDELWPAGEDLVEVILDPSGEAVSPGDLVHVVVKAGGAVVGERGFGCLERVAPFEPLPALVRAGVEDHPREGRWIVELSIDLTALGGHAPVMGINFGRFVPRLGEYSSWSGARRHLYSPAGLGNLQLLPPRQRPESL